MRAITVTMDLARVVTRQCEYIIKIYSVFNFSVSRIAASLGRSLSVRKDLNSGGTAKYKVRFCNNKTSFSKYCITVTRTVSYPDTGIINIVSLGVCCPTECV